MKQQPLHMKQCRNQPFLSHSKMSFLARDVDLQGRCFHFKQGACDACTVLHTVCVVLHTVHANTCTYVSFTHTTTAHALSHSLAHLAVPYGGRQDARLEPKYMQSLYTGLMRDTSRVESRVDGWRIK
jgi:hypothetical protein